MVSSLVWLFLAGVVSSVSGEGKCVWYGKCGPDPEFGDDRHILNCAYDGPAQAAGPEALELLSSVCPHLSSFSSLCCDLEQLRDMETSLTLPSAILARCPTCMANFRKNFCDLTCHPHQSTFVNASKHITAKDFKGKKPHRIQTLVLSPKYLR